MKVLWQEDEYILVAPDEEALGKYASEQTKESRRLRAGDDHGQISKTIIVQIPAYVNIETGNFSEKGQIPVGLPLDGGDGHKAPNPDILQVHQ